MFPVYEEKKENLHLHSRIARHESPHLHNSVEFIYLCLLYTSKLNIIAAIVILLVKVLATLFKGRVSARWKYLIWLLIDVYKRQQIHCFRRSQATKKVRQRLRWIFRLADTM